MDFNRIAKISSTLDMLSKIIERDNDIEIVFDIISIANKITKRLTIILGEELTTEFDIEEDNNKLFINIIPGLTLIAKCLLNGEVSIDMDTSNEDIKKALGYNKTSKTFSLVDPSSLIHELEAIRRIVKKRSE